MPELVENHIVGFPMRWLKCYKEMLLVKSCECYNSTKLKSKIVLLPFEPQHEKTSHCGFRPGLTQTILYSHRKWLEAFNSGYTYRWNSTIHAVETKALISCAVTAQLFCAFCFCLGQNSGFLMMWINVFNKYLLLFPILYFYKVHITLSEWGDCELQVLLKLILTN